jgi:hypothetical protein
MKLYTKEELITELQKIARKGWIKNAREGNSGGIGNTLEDLLGIEENNLPIPNAAEWELKTQRLNTSSLITLFHMEPSPRAIEFVPKILLSSYAWKHQEAGKKYSENEMSFRQTIHGGSASDRGFMVKIDRQNRKILISFDYTKVAENHKNWLKEVKNRVGLNELTPQPYWGFDDLASKARTKLLNCFYVQAEVKKENGNVFIDFDARTGHIL